ncbi:MAG: ribose 5-phosphate isomerase B [Bryobacteraceae bacterium]
MKIAIGADHAGFALKERLRRQLLDSGHEVIDHGANSEISCDYPDFAAVVARDVSSGDADRGLLICATGIGMAIAANKIPGIRAAVATSLDGVRLTREHNDLNVLALGAKATTPPEAEAYVSAFLNTGFAGGRHARRVAKIAGLENMHWERND